MSDLHTGEEWRPDYARSSYPVEAAYKLAQKFGTNKIFETILSCDCIRVVCSRISGLEGEFPNTLFTRIWTTAQARGLCHIHHTESKCQRRCRFPVALNLRADKEGGVPHSVILSSTIHNRRRKPSPSAMPKNRPPTTPASPVEFMKKLATIHPRTKDTRALAASSGVIALSIGSPSRDPLDTALNEPGSSGESGWKTSYGESGWKTAYGTARMAVEVAKESSDMFLPLKAVVGALSVLIKNHDVSPPQVFHPVNH